MRFSPIFMAALAAAVAVNDKRDTASTNAGEAAPGEAVDLSSSGIKIVSAAAAPAAYCGGFSYAGCSNYCYNHNYYYYDCVSYSGYCWCHN